MEEGGPDNLVNNLVSDILTPGSPVHEIISEIHPLALLYASPFGIMELVAYSIGMSRSLLLAQKLLKKMN